MIAAVGVTEDGSVLVGDDFESDTSSCDSLVVAAGATILAAVAAVFVDGRVLATTSSLTLRAATRLLSRLVRHDCGGRCD